MGSLFREYDRCSIEVDAAAGIILVRQRWRYTWVQGYLTSPWTLVEQQAMHRSFEAAILRGWSNRAWVRVTGKSPYARKLAGRELSLRFDIQRVTKNPHWTVTVKKIRPGTIDGSGVKWKYRQVILDSADARPEDKVDAAGRYVGTQIVVAHEFGHMLGTDDEYANARPNSPHVRDLDSMMNVGGGLRARHFNTVVAELNRLVPETIFAVSRVR